MTRFTEDGGCVLGWSGDEPDDELFIAADATSPSPEWPPITDVDDEYDLEGTGFLARVRAQQLSRGEAA